MSYLYAKQKAPVQQYNDIVQIVEVENEYNREGKCNFCDGVIYWNPAVIHRRTKNKLPLQEKYEGHGTSAIPHRGCKYNTENFYKMVILESDTVYQKARKMKEQRKLMGFDYMSQQKKYPVPSSWKDYCFEY